MYYNRNLITAEQHPATLADASGVFDLQSQASYRSENEWPFGDDVGFVVVVKIETNTEIELRKVNSIAANYTVDWGDGSSFETSAADNLPHTYVSPGTYVIKGAINSGTWVPWANHYKSQIYFTKFELRNQTSPSTTTYNYRPFMGMFRLESVALPYSFFNSFTNFNSAFADCHSLKSIPLFNTSNATNLGALFDGCYSLTEVPLLDTSSCQAMAYMFRECFNLKSIPLFDTSNCTNFSAFARLCVTVESFPSLDFSSATSCGYMCHAMTMLKHFPANMFDTCTMGANFLHFGFVGCDLTVQSVENILLSVDTNGATGNTLAIQSGSNAAYSTWSQAAKDALTSLQGKSWTVTYNS